VRLSQAPVHTRPHPAVGSKGARGAMYLQRRNGVYWFRKVTPLDLVNSMGQTDVRCSLRTTRRDVAKRRAGQLLVALEHVYEVLRSEEPLGPAKILLGNFAQDFVEHGAGTPEGIGAPRLPSASIGSFGRS